MPITVPDTAKGAFDGNMQSSAKIELPFNTPPFWIVNGKPAMKSIGGVGYFGGWACEGKKLEAARESWENIPVPPPNLTSDEIALDNGDLLQCYTARAAYFATIGVRMFSTVSVNGETRRVAPFTPGARPAIQVLALMGYKDENKVIQPWVPVLLTAKGYQVNHLRKAVDTWTNTVKPLLKRMGMDGLHPGLFWAAIGTFGNERKQELVGGTNNRKPITPVQVYIPQNLDEAMLEALYVGPSVAEFMATTSAQAKEWLHAFDNLPQAPKPETAHQDYGEPPIDEPPPPEDDIPF